MSTAVSGSVAEVNDVDVIVPRPFIVNLGKVIKREFAANDPVFERDSSAINEQNTKKALVQVRQNAEIKDPVTGDEKFWGKDLMWSLAQKLAEQMSLDEDELHYRYA